MESVPVLLSFAGLCIFTVFSSFIGLIAIFANASVIFAFFRSYRLRNNLSNYFAINLAISDILVSIGPLPLWILNLWHIRIRNFSTTSKGIIPADSVKVYATVWQFFDAVLINAAVCNLAFLSVERYFAIARPIMHRAKVSKQLMLTVCALTWVYAFASVGPSIAFERGGAWIIAYKAVIILVPCLVMLFAYGALVVHILIQRRNRNNAIVSTGFADSLPSAHRFFSNGREIKLTFRLSLLTLAFILCWLPYITWIIWYTTSDNVQALESQSYFYDVSISLKYLSYFNSLLNPFLYVFGRPAFSSYLKGVFFKKKDNISSQFHRCVVATPLSIIGSSLSLATVRDNTDYSNRFEETRDN